MLVSILQYIAHVRSCGQVNREPNARIAWMLNERTFELNVSERPFRDDAGKLRTNLQGSEKHCQLFLQRNRAYG